METLIGDLRLAARNLARRWRTSLVVIATLALGIGANTVIFSFISAILLEPLPYPEPDRLVRIESVRGAEAGLVSLRELEDLKQEPSLFIDVAAHGRGEGGYNLAGDGHPEEVPALLCTRNLFSVLGVELALGDPWPPEADRTTNYSVVIGHDLWQRRWGGSPHVLSATLSLDGAELYRVYGALPRGFDYPDGQQLYRSVAFYDLDYEDRGRRHYFGLGRLRPGVSLGQAQAAVDRLAARLERDYPATNAGIGLRLVPLKELYVGEARPFLLLLLGAVGFVLAIACANVANVLVAQAIEQSREVAVRRALGASGARIVGSWLLEGLLAGAAGGVVALAVAFGGVRLLRALLAVELPRWMQLGLDGRVLVFTAAVALGAGAATALLPAWQASRAELFEALGASARGSSSGRSRQLARHGLVLLQVAVTSVLLLGAGLMVKSFQALRTADLGFEPESLLSLRVNLGWKAYEEAEQVRGYFRRLSEQLATLPGVSGVTIASNPPFGGVVARPSFVLEGQSEAEQQRNPYVNHRVVGADYFEVVGTALLAGRGFDPRRDLPGGPPVAVLGRRAAESFWPGQDPLGQRLRLLLRGPEQPWLEVVGVVEDVRQERVGEPPGLDVYVDAEQFPEWNMFVLVRSAADLRALIAPATEAALRVDRDQSTWDPRPMARRVADSLWRERLAGTLVGLFGVLAALLAAVGIYGVLAATVRQRRREIGIRMALGARAAQVVAGVLGDTGRWVLAGAVIGSLAGWALARLLRGLLYETSPSEPAIWLGMPLLILALAALGAWVPARRVVRVDPMRVLREE